MGRVCCFFVAGVYSIGGGERVCGARRMYVRVWSMYLVCLSSILSLFVLIDLVKRMEKWNERIALRVECSCKWKKGFWCVFHTFRRFLTRDNIGN